MASAQNGPGAGSAATTPAPERAAAVFQSYAKIDGRNTIDGSDLMAALGELGLLAGGDRSKDVREWALFVGVGRGRGEVGLRPTVAQ